MMQISQIVFLALMELLFVLLVTVAVTAFFTLRRRSRERVAAQRLAAKVKKALPERASQVNGLVQSAFAEDAVQQQAFGSNRFVDPERKLMSRIINAWVQHDPAAFAGLDVAVNECIQSWVDCVQAAANRPAPVSVAEPVEADTSGLEAEITRLQAANEQLDMERKATLDAMSRMLVEYSNLHGGVEDGARSPTMDEILSYVISARTGQQPCPSLDEVAPLPAVASTADAGDELEVESGAADVATADAPDQAEINALMDDIEVAAEAAPAAVVESDDDIDIEISPHNELSADEVAAIAGDASHPESVSEEEAPPEKQAG